MPIHEIGSRAYLSRVIIEPDCGDHPAFLMGIRGELVTVRGYNVNFYHRYSVEGTVTNPGRTFGVHAKELMFTKPMRQG